MKYSFVCCAAFAAVLVSSCGDPSVFDEKHITLSFGVVSDTHIDGTDTPTARKFTSAMEQLRDKALEQDPDGLDGILIAGDLTNNPYSSESNYVQADYFKNLYESVFDPVETPMIYTPGNHDVYREWTEAAISQAKNISGRLGEDYTLTDLDLPAWDSLECRHCRVGDCDILCILPVGRRPVVYTDGQKAWLDATLKSVTGSRPDRYVLVLTHPMISGTVYGSMLGDYWATEDLTPILSKYPQAVVFGGHLHFPLNDPRSIWQGAFTVLGCGSVRYMAIENGRYEYMSGKTVMKNSGEFSQGLLVQFDRRGNMRITRMDFYNKAEIAEPWLAGHPCADGSHLLAYSVENRYPRNCAPVLDSLALYAGSPDEAGLTTVTARFPAGRDDEFVHHYSVSVCGAAGDTVCFKKYLSDFYLVPQPSMMKAEWEEPLASLPAGEYAVSLTAYDSWDAQSNTLTESITIE